MESSDVFGTAVASILTWDTKVTSVVAMLGGTGPLIGRFLGEDELLERFKGRVGGPLGSAALTTCFRRVLCREVQQDGGAERPGRR